MRRVLVLAALVSVAGSAAAQRKGGRCTGEASDTSGGGPPAVFRDCDVDQPAKVRQRIRPAFEPAFAGPGNGCYRTELEFVVDTAGRPELAAVRIVSGNSPEFAAAVRALLPELLYTPAVRDGQPVRQLVRYKASLATKGRVVFGRPSDLPDPPGRRPPC